MRSPSNLHSATTSFPWSYVEEKDAHALVKKRKHPYNDIAKKIKIGKWSKLVIEFMEFTFFQAALTSLIRIANWGRTAFPTSISYRVANYSIFINSRNVVKKMDLHNQLLCLSV